MASPTHNLVIDAASVAPTELHRLSGVLLKDIRALGVVVGRASVAVPSDTKSGTGYQLGELILTGSLSAATVTAIATVVSQYIKRTSARSVTWRQGDREVTFTGISSTDQAELVRLLAESGGEDHLDREC